MKNGGFNAVIGNPPYVRIQGFPKEQVEYLTNKYATALKNCDLYVSFIEKGFQLLKADGILGEILPNKFFKTDYGVGLRQLLSSSSSVFQIVDFGSSQVFDASTYTALLFLKKGTSESFLYKACQADNSELLNIPFSEFPASSLTPDPWTFADKTTSAIISKLLQGSKKLLDLPAEMSRGSSTGDDDVFVLENGTLEVEKTILRVPLFATDFGRYRFSLSDKWRIIFPYEVKNGKAALIDEGDLKKKFPKAYEHLQQNQPRLKKRKQFTKWFGYSAPRNLELHNSAQIVVPLLADKGMFSIVPLAFRGKLCPMASGGFSITISKDCNLSEKYILGLLNSKLLFWNLQIMSNVFRGGWITCTKQYFGELPIHTIDFSNQTSKFTYEKIITLVDQMIDLSKRLIEAEEERAKKLFRS
ncbi:MAG: Eco57I restriction-modification methylase domain-containing protein, partial [Alphaproteobacteria bacterium]|nr:Eco57I restriction-modification methylase domain-containing protein [Alphaproteobacteria bacterium]